MKGPQGNYLLGGGGRELPKVAASGLPRGSAGAERNAAYWAQRSVAQAGREGTGPNRLSSGQDCFYKRSQPFPLLYTHAHTRTHVCPAMPWELTRSVLHIRPATSRQEPSQLGGQGGLVTHAFASRGLQSPEASGGC